MLRLFFAIFLSFGAAFAAPEASMFEGLTTSQKPVSNLNNNSNLKPAASVGSNLNSPKPQNPKRVADPNAQKQISIEEMRRIAPTDEPDDVDPNQIYQKIETKRIDFDATVSTRSAFVYQVFSVKLRVDTNQELAFDLNLSMSGEGVNILTSRPEWHEPRIGVYETTVWLACESKDASLAPLAVSLSRNGEFYGKQSIDLRLPRIKTLEGGRNFAHVVADEIMVKKTRSSKYDEANNLVTVELEGKNTNLASFYIPQNFEKQGVEGIRGTFAAQSANAFVIARKDVKFIDFSYYNLKTSKFENFRLPIEVEDDDLSTQIDLNPQESEFKQYKDIALYSAIVIFLTLFIFARSWYSLVIAALIGAYCLYDNKPFSDATINAQTEVRILPTKNSTIFYRASAGENAKVILQKGEYSKILLENGKIGWVKNENLK